MARANWTETQLVEVLKLYCSTPFGKIHSRNPEIVSLAATLGRTPGAVALKMANFASLDPTISQKGMSGSSALDKAIWNEFFSNMDGFLSDNDRGDRDSGFSEPEVHLVEDVIRIGIDRIGLSKLRTNQSFFRRMILASYDARCAITGISEPELLVASHIVPWSVDKAVRLDPRNGICLNALHDRAFDKGLIPHPVPVVFAA